MLASLHVILIHISTACVVRKHNCLFLHFSTWQALIDLDPLPKYLLGIDLQPLYHNKIFLAFQNGVVLWALLSGPYKQYVTTPASYWMSVWTLWDDGTYGVCHFVLCSDPMLSAIHLFPHSTLHSYSCLFFTGVPTTASTIQRSSNAIQYHTGLYTDLRVYGFDLNEGWLAGRP